MKKKLWNPIFGGIMIGIAMILTFYISGRGLGASGAMTDFAVWLQNLVAPSINQSSGYFSKYVANGANPLNDYLIFMAIGILIGSFLAGLVSKDLKFEVLKGPNISNKGRLIYALIGGIFIGYAARMARGCTSGQALVGGAELSVGSWAFMFAIFAGGFAVAYFVRREWI
jgi:uncharacterized membrane protein YedE/YeeE